MKNLILFDIDGTLLRCGPQVRPLFVDALVKVFGSYQGLEGYDFAGKTDPHIVIDLVRHCGLDQEEILQRLPEMQQIYLANLARGLRRERMRLLPGVIDLLEQLTESSEVMLGLLTGNWRGGAEIKLSRFGLNRYFSLGAFGDDAVSRRDLVPVALARAAELTGSPFEPHRVLIIGDTVRDVDCAQAAGVPSMAVATGFTDKKRLKAAGADWVFDDLEEAAQEFAWFMSGSWPPSQTTTSASGELLSFKQ